MDTRIKLGIIFKLKIPEHIRDRLTYICAVPLPKYWKDRVMFYEKVLGTRQLHGHYPGIYTLRYYDDDYINIHNNNRVRWEMLHLGRTTTTFYALDSDDVKWAIVSKL
jgi:hypothetical protein